MHWIDVCLLVLLLIGGYIGWRLGSIFVVSCACAGYAGAWAASRYNMVAAQYFHNFPYPSAASSAALFTAGVAVVLIGGWILRAILDSFIIGILDHIAGGLLGVSAAMTVCAVLLFTAMSFSRWSYLNKTVRRSYSAKMVVRVADKFFISPQDVLAYLSNTTGGRL